MIYEWTWGMPVSAQAAGERLEAIEKQHGEVTPKLVLDDARDENSILHSCFEWRDSVAAELYREKQAGDLIRNIKVVVQPAESTEPKQIRAFVSVVDDEKKRRYVNLEKSLSEQKYRDQALTDAFNSLKSFREKYNMYRELSGVISEIDKLNIE